MTANMHSMMAQKKAMSSMAMRTKEYEYSEGDYDLLSPAEKKIVKSFQKIEKRLPTKRSAAYKRKVELSLLNRTKAKESEDYKNWVELQKDIVTRYKQHEKESLPMIEKAQKLRDKISKTNGIYSNDQIFDTCPKELRYRYDRYQLVTPEVYNLEISQSVFTFIKHLVRKEILQDFVDKMTSRPQPMIREERHCSTEVNGYLQRALEEYK